MSIDDFQRAYEKHYQNGIVICHDSTIFKYSIEYDRILSADDWFDINIQTKAVNSIKDREESIKNLAKRGIKVEVFYVTR